MIPILYAKNASDFSNNGIGILKDAISCEVSEERNGSYSLTLKYPISGNWFSSIGEGSIVKAKPNEISEPQLFRIRKSSKPIKGTVTFYADHISYDLSGLPVMGLTMASTTPGAAMTEAIEASPIQSGFTAWSDIGTLHGIDITEPRSVRALIGGQAGSVLSIWGGELEFDNFVVKLHSSRGSNNGVILNYGKNITDAKQERNIESCYTHFCPYAVKTVNTTSASGEIIDQQKITVKLSEEIIELVDPHDIGHSRALILDMSDQFGEGEEITEAALRIKAEEYIESHELGTPEVNITVKFVQIWDTPEYESFAALERVRLCDVVTVRFEELGISATAKVIKTVYDVLKERYSSIEIGSAKESLADSFESVEGQIKETSETVSENKSAQEAALNNAIIEATNKITGNAGGYVVLHPANYPSEILIMNTNDINTATKVWRWNSSGLGYSSNGYAGTYGLAMTIDGSIVADYITTGTLTAINISGCTISGGTLNIGSGKFQVDSSGNIHAEGFIKATSGEIGGCSIVNGVLQVPVANIIGSITATALEVKSGSYTYFKAGDGAVQIGGFNVDNNSLYSGSTFSNSAVFLCTGSTGYLTIGGHYGTSWGLKVGTKFGVNTSGELYCTSAHLSGSIDATSGKIGNEIYNFSIGSSGDSASIYCGTSSLAGAGGLGTASNNVYIGTDGFSLKISDTGFDYTTVLRSGIVMTYGDANGSGRYNRGIVLQTYTQRFINSGTVKIGTSYAPNYQIAAFEMSQSTNYVLMSGTFKSTNSIAVISDRNAKNAIEALDGRYIDLFDNLTPIRYKYNAGTSDRYHTGFIAQDVKNAMEEAGIETSEFAALCFDHVGTTEETWSLRYEEFIAVIVAKIKALEERISALEG